MIFHTVLAVSEALRRGETTSAALTEAMLTHIRASGSGAYLTICGETAMEQAIQADKMRRTAPGTVHPLCGIPYSLKDNLVTAGIRTTCSSRILSSFVPSYSAAVYEKLQACGSVLLGKTDMDEFAMGSAGHYSALGHCINPLDPTRSAGGSSSGAAVSVAGGEAYFALGSDTGGSARQPASFCGLVAMKPTYGLVSRFGLVEFASSMDTVCPITHTVADNRLVLSAIAGRDTRDMTSTAVPKTSFAALTSLAGVRVGVMQEYQEFCDAATARCTERIEEMLRDLGAVVTHVALPPPEIAVDVYVTIAAAEASSNLARYDGIRYGTGAEGDSFNAVVTEARTSGFGDEVKRRILAGKYALSSVYNGDYYRRVTCVRAEIIKQVSEILRAVDVILMPSTGSVAFPKVSPGEDPDVLYGSDSFTVYANLTGLPAIQIPSGGDGRLPCGVSLLGRRFAEPLLYDIASWIENEAEPYQKKEWRRAYAGE